MRAYEQTHPWLNFQLDLSAAHYKIWLLLGQAQANCTTIAGLPLLPDVAQQMKKIYLAKGVLATTAIEGNTLTEEEVQKLIEGQLNLPPSKKYLGQEIDNIITACNQIAERVLTSSDTSLCVEEIKNYNKQVLNHLATDEDTLPGQIRQHKVGVGRYRGAPPEDLEYLVGKLCEWLNTGFDQNTLGKMPLYILKAIVAHVYLAWIHPFGDGNGRVARLVEFQILLSAGVPTTAAHLLSNHYNQTRTEYYRMLDQSHRHPDGLLDFIAYALQGLVDSLEEQIEEIKQQQLRVHWRNYIYDCFKTMDSATSQRQRRLILDLSEHADPVPVASLRHVSPRIAEAYAGKTDKTVLRDVSELEEMGLVEKSGKSVRAKTEIVRAFLPRARSY
jgi:Fic family protein